MSAGSRVLQGRLASGLFQINMCGTSELAPEGLVIGHLVRHARGRTLAYNNVFYLARLRLSRRGSPNQIGGSGGVPELTSGRDVDAPPAVSTPAEEAVSSSDSLPSLRVPR